MPPDIEDQQTASKVDLLSKVITGAVATAMLGVLFLTYEHTSKMAQFMIDHMHAHELEESACAAFRSGIRREFDLLWEKVDKIDREAHQK